MPGAFDGLKSGFEKELSPVSSFLKKSPLTILFILLTLAVNFSFAQRPDLRFEKFNTSDGLCKNFVWKIVQDDKGIMWFGTENGLNKFDAYNFSIYQSVPSDKNSLRSNSIRSLYIDKQKNLWVGTSEGLHLYDRKNDNFVFFKNLKKSVEAIFEDSHNNFWIATNYRELYLLDRGAQTFSIFLKGDTAENRIGSRSSLFEDSEKTLWYLNEKEIQVINRSNKTASPVDIGFKIVTGMFEDSRRNLWFSSGKEGILQYNRETKTYTRYKHDPQNPNSLSDDAVFCITEDHTGKLWFGTDHGGLNILDAKEGKFYTYAPNASDPWCISSQSVGVFYRDANDMIWLGTFNGGINLATVQKFGHHRNSGGDGKGLNHNNILSFCEDHTGNIWISTDGGGLNYFDPRAGKFTYFVHDHANKQTISNNFVTNVMEDRTGQIWAGFWNGGLDKFDPAGKNTMHFRNDPSDNTSIVSNDVWKIFEDSDRNLWVGTTDGLDKFDREKQLFIHYNKANSGISNNSILNLFEDKEGDLWVATSDGLNLFDKKKHTFTAFLNNKGDSTSISNNVIRSVFQD
jgi:ligand-binding sensor domain-containing protein